MNSTNEVMNEFRNQLKKGSIQKAYGTLISTMTGLRKHFVNKYGEGTVSGLYQGYMDMTYFAIFPSSLKQRDLKIAIVFNYEAFRFEAWLSARNRKIQRQYWELFKGSHWSKYRVVTPEEGIDSIVECDLEENPSFDDPTSLAVKIENRTSAFIEDIEKYISESQSESA